MLWPPRARSKLHLWTPGWASLTLLANQAAWETATITVTDWTSGRCSDFPKHITVTIIFLRQNSTTHIPVSLPKALMCFDGFFASDEVSPGVPSHLGCTHPHQHTARLYCFLSFFWATKADWAWVLTAQQPCGHRQVALLSASVFCFFPVT